MTVRFDTKAPGEDITCEFIFTALGTPSAPVVDIAVLSGTDASPESIRLGSPAIVGTTVLQRITGGVDGVDYALRCWAQIGADRLLIDAILPVRARPSPAG